MFIKPCNGNITSHFNKKRVHPRTGKVQPHYGIDYGNHSNNDIYAAADGRVTRVGYLKETYGSFIYITHKINGVTYQTTYAHLASIKVKLGDNVSQGQVIGVKGNTGDSTGIHLHFEIHVGGRNGWNNVVDPFHYVTDRVVQVSNKVKTVQELAEEVNKGLHGNGDKRKLSLGSRYHEVQEYINSGKPKQKTVKELASEVNRGLHGNGEKRKKSLGNRYDEVQNYINRMR